jgi:hypothetical protein
MLVCEKLRIQQRRQAKHAQTSACPTEKVTAVYLKSVFGNRVHGRISFVTNHKIAEPL